MSRLATSVVRLPQAKAGMSLLLRHMAMKIHWLPSSAASSGPNRLSFLPT